MTTVNLLIILASAFIHLIAHIGMKKTTNGLAFIWLMFFAISLLYLPILFLFKQPVELKLWPLIIISALFETLYFFSASKAYQTEDLSIVYPMMRGAAPIFILLGSIIVLHERLTILGILGIFVIALGLWLVNLNKFNQWHTIMQKLNFPGVRWALFAGLCISLYTIIDKIGVGNLNAFLYTYLALSFTFLLLTPLAFKIVGWEKIKKEFLVSKWMIILSGLTTFVAYALVLFVIRRGMPAAYAGSIREISIVISGLVGFLFLKEKFLVVRISGSILIALGVAVISIFG